MRALALTALILTLTGCDPFAQPETMLDEYNARLARVLDVDAELSPLPPAPRFPQSRDRLRDIEPISISMIDFLGLYGCDLQFVVGERNSILGRVAHPLTRLDYERRFIVAAEVCAATLERESLAERLIEAAEAKRQSLSDVAWNAVWSGREIEHHFARSRGPLPVNLDRLQTSQSAQNAMLVQHHLSDLLNGQLEQDLGALDAVYQRWTNDPMAGQALMSAILVTTRLNDASRLIEQRLDERPLCPSGRPNQQAEILRNLFVAIYAGEVQPYLSVVQRVRRELFPPLLALAQLDEQGPGEAFQHYVAMVLDADTEASYWQAFDQAIARHTQAWQSLLDQCGMTPADRHQTAYSPPPPTPPEPEPVITSPNGPHY